MNEWIKGLYIILFQISQTSVHIELYLKKKKKTVKYSKKLK